MQILIALKLTSFVPLIPALRSALPALGAVVLGWQLASVPAAAAADEPVSPRVFQFNVSPNGYPPYMIVDDNGQYSGIVWEVVNRIATEMNYRVEAKKVPRKRVDQMLIAGYIDATPRAIEWTEHPERYTFTQPIVRIEEVFFSPIESDFNYQTPSDLTSKTIVTHLGYHYPELADVFESGQAKRFDVANDRDMFSFLIQGNNFDAAIADLALGQWILRQNGWRGKLTTSNTRISNYGYRLMLRKDWTEFASAFNQQLAKLKESGELAQIMDRYR